MFRPQTTLSTYLVSAVKDGTTISGLWKRISGAVSSTSNGSVFTIGTTSEHILLTDIRYVQSIFRTVTFGLTGVETPTNLNANVEIGLKEPQSGAKITILLDQSADNVVFTATKEDGTSATLTRSWKTSWNSDADGFNMRIAWFVDRVAIYINGEIMFETRDNTVTTTPGIPRDPMHVYFSVVGTDVVTLKSILLDNAEQNSLIIV